MIKWLKKLFTKLSRCDNRKNLRDKVVEMYGEEAGEAYDKINSGTPMGGFLETAMFLQMIEDARKALEE